MISFNQIDSPQVLNNHISVQVAASYSGYSLQYLSRLLCNHKLEGTKIGQMWLVDKGLLDLYLEQAQDAPISALGRGSFFIFPASVYKCKRYLFTIEALVSFHKSAHQNNELEEILGKITNLLEAMNNGGESVKFVQETFPGAFVESLSKSVKSGMKIQ